MWRSLLAMSGASSVCCGGSLITVGSRESRSREVETAQTSLLTWFAENQGCEGSGLSWGGGMEC